MKALKTGSVSQGDFDRAKAQLKNTITEDLETSSARFEDLVAQALHGDISGKSELIAAIDAITVADVNAVSSSFLQQMIVKLLNRNYLLVFRRRKRWHPANGRLVL